MSDGSSPVRILFVCMGNICRSPTAQGVFEKALSDTPLGREVIVDSAGTHAHHVDEPPDRRSQKAARARGIDLSAQRARRVAAEDFETFDYVVAMDRDNLAKLTDACPEDRRDRLFLFLDFTDEHIGEDVPDPYYGGARGFERVLDLVEAAAAGLLARLRQSTRS